MIIRFVLDEASVLQRLAHPSRRNTLRSVLLTERAVAISIRMQLRLSRTSRLFSSRRVEAFWWTLAPALAVLVAGTLRVGDVSMWLDEAFTAEAVRLPLADFLRFLRIEAGMGPYYFSLWCWARLAGYSPEAIRMWSVIGAAVAVGAFGTLLSRRWMERGSRPLVAIGLLTMICHPLFLRMITEARAYSWMIAGSAIALVLLDRQITDPSVGRVAWIALALGVFGALHPVSLYFHAVVLLVALAAHEPRSLRRPVSLAALLPSLLVLPFLWVIYEFGSGQTRWIGPFNWLEAGGVVNDFTGWPLLVFPLLTLGVTASLRSVERRGSLRHALIRFRHELLLVIPLLLLTIQSFRVNGFFIRYLSPLLPILILQATRGIEVTLRWLRPVWGRVATLGVVGGVVVLLPPSGRLLSEKPRPQDYRSVADHLNGRDWTDTHLYVTNRFHTPGLWLYGNDAVKQAWFPRPDHDVKPWDRLSPNGVVAAPSTCAMTVVEPPRSNGAIAALERRFTDNWMTEAHLVETVEIAKFVVYTFANPDCAD